MIRFLAEPSIRLLRGLKPRAAGVRSLAKAAHADSRQKAHKREGTSKNVALAHMFFHLQPRDALGVWGVCVID